MRRTIIELLHMAGGVLIALLIGWGAAWAVPLAARDIWWVDAAAIFAVLVMGIVPLRTAWRADRRAAEARAERIPPAHG